MSLPEEWKEPCELLENRRTPDGESGFHSEWVIVGDFMASINFENSLEAKVAESQGVTSLFTITTDKAAALRYHDVIRRKSTGETLRVTSEGTDKQTPDMATFAFSQVSAEKWSLTK
jgi:hypothetical protein